ncbi:MAG: hypothetical protein ISR45_04100 [Rhodospirillales bacterium]|nr:hypothetical protein [Rhodospirillales bacterium]
MSILSAMEKAMCRQHIMWPIDGELPCETDQTCLKSDLCREMAEEVMDYSRTLKSTRE